MQGVRDAQKKKEREREREKESKKTKKKNIYIYVERENGERERYIYICIYREIGRYREREREQRERERERESEIDGGTTQVILACRDWPDKVKLKPNKHRLASKADEHDAPSPHALNGRKDKGVDLSTGVVKRSFRAPQRGQKKHKASAKSDQKVAERATKTKKNDRTPSADLLLWHPDCGSAKPAKLPPNFPAQFLSAAPQQSEMCVKFSVFFTPFLT